jgi:ATP sulfurylase
VSEEALRSYLELSDQDIREQLLRDGEVPPPEFSRPEVAKVLIEAMRGVVA